MSGYRLLTDGEWELACRAGTTTSRYFGNTSELVAKYAWTLERQHQFALASNQTAILSQRVAQLLPNRWGLFDLYGNASELCDLGVAPQEALQASAGSAEDGTVILDQLAKPSSIGPDWPLIRGPSLMMPGVQYAHSHCRTNQINGTYARGFGLRIVRTLSVEGAAVPGTN